MRSTYTLVRRWVAAFQELLTGWDGEQVAVRYDAELATWMFIARPLDAARAARRRHADARVRAARRTGSPTR